MKIVSWNVNGLRACIQKGFYDFVKENNADIYCIQETKMQPYDAIIELPGYEQYWNSAEKKGYSGTAIFTRVEPKNVIYGIGIEEHDKEGRVITLEFDEFYLVTVYTPNSKRELLRLEYRMTWEDEFRKYICKLDKIKPVVFCGDLNVAHKEIDLKNPKTNTRNAGFTIEERDKMTEMLEMGFVDTYRHFFPEAKGAYTWWSYMMKAREKNVGWRIDYFVISKRIVEYLKQAYIHNEVLGSDHCPIEIEIFN